jgi:hypothetical protein
MTQQAAPPRGTARTRVLACSGQARLRGARQRGRLGDMQRSQVLLTKAKDKLDKRGRLVKWADYEPGAAFLGEARPARRGLRSTR